MTREYQTLQAYGQSKTASNLFALELDSRGQKFNVRAYSLHPGSINGTELGREALELFKQMGTHDANGNIKQEIANKLKTISQGAATTIWCTTSSMLNNIGGVYCEDADIAELDLGTIEHRQDDFASMRGVQPYSLDIENAKRLWKLSEQMTGLTFSVE